MLEWNEIVRSLTGAYEVFLDRPNASQHFDLSINGFWRSFRAIVLVAPLYALSAIAERAVALGDPSVAADFNDGLFILDKAAALIIDWVALPVVLALLASRIGIARTYPAFIIVRNWAAVLSILPFALIGLLFTVGTFGPDTADIMTLAGLIIVLRYNYLIARRVMEAPVGLAVAVVVGDFILSMAIASAVDLVFGQ
jgi:hypothetical protein